MKARFSPEDRESEWGSGRTPEKTVSAEPARSPVNREVIQKTQISELEELLKSKSVEIEALNSYNDPLDRRMRELKIKQKEELERKIADKRKIFLENDINGGSF